MVLPVPSLHAVPLPNGAAPPMRSILADDQLLEVLPWTDVIVDVQGPYTKAESGEQYVVRYRCTRRKVPKL
eukprot:8329820-Alexandrium_andersonii.AAC.1